MLLLSNLIKVAEKSFSRPSFLIEERQHFYRRKRVKEAPPFFPRHPVQ